MNISNLVSGLILKNYKDLCTTLEIPIKNGKSKTLQLEDLSRYCTYTRDKNKYIITEVFTEPLEKMDKRIEGNNSKYVEHFKFLLLNKLSQCEGYKCTFTKNNLFEFLGMVNPLYLKKTFAKQQLTKYDDRISSFDINNFYLRANDRMTRILFSSLNSLKNQFLINYREVDIIVRKDIKGKEEHREATTNEIKILMNVKYNVLLDMGLNSMTQVIFKFKTEEFYSKVNEVLKKEYDIEYSYKQFELIFAKENILHELSLLESKKHREELNEKTINAVNCNSQNVYNKNIEKYEQELEEFLFNEKPTMGRYTESQFKGFRLRSEYIDIQYEISEFLLRLLD